MKQCPICHIAMKRKNYEGLGIYTCPQCKGHLVRKIKLKQIKKTRDKTSKELQAHALNFRGSSSTRLRCPHCFSHMKKKTFLHPINIELDLCSSCDAVWLDAGELAMLQLAYESSGKLKDAVMLKKRYLELENSPERRKRFKENLAKMRKGPDYILSAFVDGMTEPLSEVIRVIASSIFKYKFPHVFVLPNLYKLFRNK